MYLDYFNEFSKRFESEETIKDYLNSLTDFSSYIKKDDIEVITDVDIRKYINYLLDNYKISTAEKKISYIKSYFKFLAESEKIKVNPFAFVKIPRASKNVKQKNILSPDDILLAINNLNTLLPVKRLLVYLFLTTGLSVSEMYILTGFRQEVPHWATVSVAGWIVFFCSKIKKN